MLYDIVYYLMIEPFHMSITEVGDLTIPQAILILNIHMKKKIEYKRQKKRAIDSVLRSNRKGLQKVVNIVDLVQD